MSRYVLRPQSGAQFVGIERDDGSLVFASQYAPPSGIETIMDGTRYVFVRRPEFSRIAADAGLQPLWFPQDARL